MLVGHGSGLMLQKWLVTTDFSGDLCSCSPTYPARNDSNVPIFGDERLQFLKCYTAPSL